MITWMQRHKKYLIITIWISTIAFVGAGFVGWGQYSYGDKAGSVAKVGSVDITMGELQKSYSNLYSQYSKMFQGNFDEEKAKSFGLKSQALKHLTQQALVLNLAKSYSLEISDKELLNEIKTQKYFFKDNVFNKEIYKSVLSRNNLSIKDYEADLKKELLIKKTLQLLPINTNPNELKIFNTAISIADKINYKVLNTQDINIDTSDEMLKPYWEMKKQNFMTAVSYDLKFIEQENIDKEYDDKTLKTYYSDNKTHFRGEDGRILNYEKAKEKVKIELNKKETKKEALRSYIAFKKDKLTDKTQIQMTTISTIDNPFTSEVLEKISSMTASQEYIKPILVNGKYYTFQLLKTNPSQTKSYADAKQSILPLFINEKKNTKLLDLAKKSLVSFNGETTDFVTAKDAIKITKLDTLEANEFLENLFLSKHKKGFVQLKGGNIVLYNILEQKLLDITNDQNTKEIVRLKSAMFNEGLIKNLQNKYKTEIFIQGL